MNTTKLNIELDILEAQVNRIRKMIAVEPKPVQKKDKVNAMAKVASAKMRARMIK